MHTNYNLIYPCAPANKDGLDKEEAEKDYTQEEEKQSKSISAQPHDSKQEEMHTMKLPELCECKYLRNRSHYA